MIRELHHIGIVVRDLDASLDFYQRLFGARVVFQAVNEPSMTEVCFVQIHGGLIELLQRPKLEDGESFGMNHIAFGSDDLEADFGSLVQAGFVPLVQPKMAAVGRLAFLQDANGARVELLQPDVTIRAERPIEHPIVQALDHYSLIAADLPSAFTFYREGLGMKPLAEVRLAASGETRAYLHFDYDVLELLPDRPPSSGSAFAHIALRVTNVDEALRALEGMGVSAMFSTPTHSVTGSSRIGFVRDPDGVQIELLDRADLREL